MAKRPSVPQFGTWENQNVGYTMFFENVRNDKNAGPKKFINPNDPQEMQYANLGGPSNRPPPHAVAPKPSQHRAKPEHHQNYNNQKPNHNYNGGPNYEPSPARSHQSSGPNKRPNAVPRFGEWEDINSTPAGGYTMQFENLKKKKDAAKASPMQIPAEPVRTPERNTYRNDTSFFSKVSRSLIPTIAILPVHARYIIHDGMVSDLTCLFKLVNNDS